MITITPGDGARVQLARRVRPVADAPSGAVLVAP
jgi:hypothetical protein